MLLENMTYEEVEEYLKKRDIILIPIGSTEQHSAFGLLGTDFITAQEIARAVGERLGVIVAPTITYGMAQHHMAFKGTISLSPLTLINLVKDVVSSLVEHGFKKIVFINGHGGNLNSIKTSFELLKYENKKGYFDVISWYLLKEVQELEKELFGDENGLHATPSEVSLTQYLRSKAFVNKKKDRDRHNLDLPLKEYMPLSKDEFKMFYPDGRMGSSPWLATIEYGRKIFEKAVETIERKIKDIENIKIPL